MYQTTLKNQKLVNGFETKLDYKKSIPIYPKIDSHNRLKQILMKAEIDSIYS